MRDLTIGALIALAVAFLASAFPVHAQTAPACRTTNDLATWYGPDDGAAFQFDSASDVSVILGALVQIAGPPPANPVVIVATVDLDRETGDFFLFAADGCFIAHLGPRSADDMQAILGPVMLPPAIPLPGNGKQHSGGGLNTIRYVHTASDNPDHPFNDQATENWFTSLTIANPDGGVDVGCCDQSDCRATKAEFQDGHWVADSAQYPGEKVVVPDANVLKNEVSPIGAAVLCEAVGGLHDFRQLTVPSGDVDYVYCFVPPPQFG